MTSTARRNSLRALTAAGTLLLVLGASTAANAAVTPTSGPDSGGNQVTLDVPTADYVQIDAGGGHTAALAADGTVWAWGTNVYGQLGDGTTTNSSIPVQVNLASLGGRTVTSVALGDSHTVALASDGTVWAWGWNGFGQLGDGTTTNRSLPVQVTALSALTITSIAPGLLHTVAVASDGTIWAWGNNGQGQLGDGSGLNSTLPVLVDVTALGGRTPVSAFAGDRQTVALASDGTAWAWGDNFAGQLGDGTTTVRIVPVQVDLTALGGRTVTGVATGRAFTLVLASDGTAWGWGDNSSGQLGDGTFVNRSTAVPVSGLLGVTLTGLSAGILHTVALASDGTVWAWGSNSFGQRGDGAPSFPDLAVPAQTDLAGLGGRTITTVNAGGSHTVALASGSTTWAWGANYNGQLGDGTLTDQSLPVQSLPSVTVTAVTFGGAAATALTQPTPGTVTVTVPAHAAGIVDVVISTTGPTTTLSAGYTYLATLAATGSTPTPTLGTGILLLLLGAALVLFERRRRLLLTRV